MDAIPSLLELSRYAVSQALELFAGRPELLAVDATAGNGQDTLFLAETLARLTSRFRVLALDVQEPALERTHKRLAEAGFAGQLRCLAAGHENLDRILGADRPIAVLYNLGFLPRGDRLRATRAETTLASLKAALFALLPGGVLSVHAYGGHSGGREEMEAVEAWFAALPFAQAMVGRYALCNKPRNPETLFLARRVERISPA